MEPPDGGYALVIVAVSIINGVLFSTPIIAIGLLLPEIIRETGSSASTVSWIPAIAFSIGLISAPLNVIFMEKYSHRSSALIGGFLMSCGLCLSYFGTTAPALFLTYGLIFGIGFGMLNNSSQLILNIYFKKHYGKALGCVISSHSLARLIFAPIIEILIEKYHYRGVFLILGGMAINSVAVSQLYHPIQSRKNMQLSADKGVENETTITLLDEITKDNKMGLEDKNDQTTSSCWNWCRTGPLKVLNFSQLKHPIFYLMFYSHLVVIILSLYVGVFLPSMVLENGLSLMQAAIVQSTRSGGEVIGRLLIPWALEHFHLHLRRFYVIVCGVQAVTLLSVIFLTNFITTAICSTLIGIVSGGIIGLSMLIVVESVGLKNMGATYSLLLFLNGIISIGYAPTIGLIRDIHGSFSICFYVLASMLLLKCILWMLKPWIITTPNDFADQKN